MKFITQFGVFASRWRDKKRWPQRRGKMILDSNESDIDAFVGRVFLEAYVIGRHEMFIDDPGPLASIEEWEAFAVRMEGLAKSSNDAVEQLAFARKIIAEKKALAANAAA